MQHALYDMYHNEVHFTIIFLAPTTNNQHKFICNQEWLLYPGRHTAPSIEHFLCARAGASNAGRLPDARRTVKTNVWISRPPNLVSRCCVGK